MAKLTDDEKRFVIEKLAQFCGHGDVARQLEIEFGVVVDRWQVRTLDPTHSKFAASEKLRELYWARRKAFESVIEEIPIAHKAYRLNMLQKMLDEARAVHNIPLALKILRQASDEAAKLNIENQQNVAKPSPFREMTPEERRIAVADMLKRALGSDRGLTSTPEQSKAA